MAPWFATDDFWTLALWHPCWLLRLLKVEAIKNNQSVAEFTIGSGKMVTKKETESGIRRHSGRMDSGRRTTLELHKKA
uniref:Putative secreted protein n=1 Tax=Anopheles marajoara TaxID=58244 RepID=A0A2M4CC80_9DIPT